MDSLTPQFSLYAMKPYANITAALSIVQWVKVTQLMTPQSKDTIIMPNTTYEAGRCLFYLAVNQIQAQVSNGVYSETRLKEYNYIVNETAGPTFTSNGTDFYFRDMWSDRDLIFSPPFKPGRNFTVTFQDFDSLSTSFSSGNSFLAGNVTTDSAGGAVGPAIPLMLLKAGNVTRAMHNMAQYMTTSLRSNDTQLLQDALQNTTVIAPDQSVKGTVWIQTQFVTVRWGWLALPCITIVLAAIFLTVVILRTKSNAVGLWKASPLTLLFYASINEQQREMATIKEGLDTADDMQKSAAGMIAKVVKGASGAAEVSIM